VSCSQHKVAVITGGTKEETRETKVALKIEFNLPDATNDAGGRVPIAM
jgi:hypothetical protein